jgi:MFS family permease
LHRSPALFGVALAVTTLTIAAAQLPVLRLAAGRRRMAVAAAMFGTLAAGWLLTLLAGNLPHPAVAAALFSCAAIFGVTETLMSPTLPPVAAELAPARSEGRYNAAFSLTLFGGGTIAPALAGMLLALGPVALPLTCAAAALLGALAAALLDRNLPASIGTIPA